MPAKKPCKGTWGFEHHSTKGVRARKRIFLATCYRFTRNLELSTNFYTHDFCTRLSKPLPSTQRALYLNATPQAIERRSICPLNSTHRSKRIRKAQQQLSVPCTVRNHCTTKLSELTLMRRPKRLHRAYNVLCSMHRPKALRDRAQRTF